MNGAVKENGKIKKFGIADVAREIGAQLIFCAFAFLISRASIFGGILPFGAAFLAAVPGDYLAGATVGCFIGYSIPGENVNSFRYLAAIFAIVAIKSILLALTKYFYKPVVISLTAGLITLGAGLVATVGDTKQTVLAVSEALISAFSAYFFVKTFRAYPRLLKGVKGEELACLLVSANIVLIGTMSLKFGEISLGKILAIAFILTVSRFGGSYAGAVGGIAAAFAVALSGESTSIALSFCLAGLFGGIFAKFGRYAALSAVILSCMLCGGLETDLVSLVELFITSLFGSALFLVIPKSACVVAGKVLSPPTRTASQNGVKKAITMRLRFASSALADVSQTVDTVAEALSKINCPDFDTLLRGIEKDACSGCSLALNCWESRKADTAENVLQIIGAIREGQKETEKCAPEEFRMRCLRPERVCGSVLNRYSDYAARISAENRLAEVRSVVSEQFSGISEMLGSMASELEREETFDEKSAARITAALKNIEINPTECSCRTDQNGRMTVDIIAPKIRGAKLSRMRLLKQIEATVDRDFEAPSITESEEKIYISLTEATAFTLQTGVCQIPASKTGVSGDAHSLFSNGRGKSFAVISDGMGTGGRAAVDGAMASGLMSRLLKAGFSYDSAISILNSAMLFKSTDESLATVDIAAVDLYSGRLEMLKAGAAPTIIRKNGKCSVAKSTSLPVGILREVGFDKASLKLKAGDIVLMMSDGVLADGEEWICKELTEGEHSAQDIAEHIAYGAKRRLDSNHPDDITVIALKVEKSV